MPAPLTYMENQKLISLGSIIVTIMCIYLLNILLNKIQFVLVSLSVNDALHMLQEYRCTILL
jgi:hypothetical protein